MFQNNFHQVIAKKILRTLTHLITSKIKNNEKGRF